MATATLSPPPAPSKPQSAPPAPPFPVEPQLYRFSVDQYHQMIAGGVVAADDRAELLDGRIVVKVPQNPAHGWTIQKSEQRVTEALPAGWCTRAQLPVALQDSEPEPDLAIARGSRADYAKQHPGAAELGCLIEVAESSLQQDRTWKAAIYSANGIPVYWIINLLSEEVEVYSDPTGPNQAPMFARKQTYGRGQSVPLVLDGNQLALIPVDDLLP